MSSQNDSPNGLRFLAVSYVSKSYMFLTEMLLDIRHLKQIPKFSTKDSLLAP